MNSEAGWLFNRTLRTATLWFSRRLGSTLQSWTGPLFHDGVSIHRQDRAIKSGKSKGGGACFLVNNQWYSDVAVISTGCSLDLEHLMIGCHPYYLPTSSVILTAVYIPPHADTNQALDELYGVIDRTESCIVAGDLSNCNLIKVLPRYHQHISCPTCGENTLDHVYTAFRDAYKALPHSPFSKSDRDEPIEMRSEP